MFPDQPNPENFDEAAEPHETNQNPTEEAAATPTQKPKRNSGRTGPTSALGRATSSRNALRHGLCSKTLILPHEHESDWLQLERSWLTAYQNPAPDTLLYTFIIKAAQAEWLRQRAQEEHDHFINNHCNAPITLFTPNEKKDFDLVQRYLTTAERRYTRDYRLLEQHWRSHHLKPEPIQPLTQPTDQQSNPEPEPIRKTLFENADTGESMDSEGNEYPAPPDFVRRPIIPGVYDPDHPAYEGPPPKNRR